MASSGDTHLRRSEWNAALVAEHPNWHGIRHPELIDFPPPRSTSDATCPAPVLRSADADVSLRRIAATAELVAAHPNWHGVRHPERIAFVHRMSEREAREWLAVAVTRAGRDLSESAALYDRIAQVANRAHSRLDAAAVSSTASSRRRTPMPAASRRPIRRPQHARFN